MAFLQPEPGSGWVVVGSPSTAVAAGLQVNETAADGLLFHIFSNFSVTRDVPLGT